jgi:hypothetical protein
LSGLETALVDLIDAPSADGPVGDKPCVLQDLQVLGYGGPTDA